MIDFIIDTICKNMKFRFDPNNSDKTGWKELQENISYAELLVNYMFNNPNDKRYNYQKFIENVSIIKNLRKKLEEVIQTCDLESDDYNKLCQNCDGVLYKVCPLYYDIFDDIPFYQEEDKKEEDEEQKTNQQSDHQPEVVVVVEDSVEKSEETDKKDNSASDRIKTACISLANFSWYQLITVDDINKLDPKHLHINDIPYCTEMISKYVKEINRHIIESEAKYDYYIAERIIYTISEFITNAALEIVQGKDPNLVHLYEERLNDIFKTIIKSTGHHNVNISFNLIDE